ncbi:YybH family protein [Planctomicrobium sp. SH664]|uniref:YybH family protein n=1 Tax=Planctomicrobium sp. SH664 TaxID=3448125 RepID=UPI003F5C1B96
MDITSWRRMFFPMLAACGIAIGLTTLGDSATPASPDEQAIRSATEAYEKAYNAGDAKALSALFSESARLITGEGEVFEGREAIENLFTTLFQQVSGSKVDIQIRGIELLDPNVAIEEGLSILTQPDQGGSEKSGYAAVHVKEGNQWLIKIARDWPALRTTPEDHLAQLSWLIGDWVDESPASLVTSSYKWSENRNFILGESTVQIAGKTVMTISQRIGWDASSRTLRSWVFDSRGGFAEGTWSRSGDGFTATMLGVNPEGERTTAVNTFRRISPDLCSFESRSRTVGGKTLPDLQAAAMARKPLPLKSVQ